MNNTPRIAIVIPARYNSSRLPGKPLADLLGKPMIQWVYEKASKVKAAHCVVIATDDKRIAQAVLSFGGQVVMTSPEHQSGTDRLVEVMQQLEADIYINLQGDEPLVRSTDIDLLASGMIANPQVELATLCHPLLEDEASNPNSVKVVLSHSGDALYFSRSLIPYPRQQQAHPGYLKHVGIYAYRKTILQQYADLPASAIEQTEQLEQLRLLDSGFKIKAFQVEPTGPGVDTPECLARVRNILAGESESTTPSLKKVKLLITDVDGVLTDGGIYYDASGECLKRFHVRDGLGMKLLEENGVKVAVLSGRDSETLRKRVTDLGLTLFQFGVKDKEAACKLLMHEAGVTREQTVCIGDDSIDLPAFSACGLSYAVADAPEYVKQLATGVLVTPGGQGALRELADAILTAQGKTRVFSSARGFQAIAHNMKQ